LITINISFSAAIVAKIRRSTPKIILEQEKIVEKLKRASDLTPCPLKFFVRPEVLVKNQNKLMKKNSAIRLHNSSGIKHPYLTIRNFNETHRF